MTDLTVITATYKRPKHLAMCLEQFHRQSLGELNVEHVVVADGPDAPVARFIAKREGARHIELDRNKGQYGAFAKDRGIQEARGEYVCFWDDDNLYDSHALTTLYATAYGADMGIVQARNFDKRLRKLILVPEKWDGTFQYGRVDTMCVCVRRELALKETWGEPEDRGRGTDYRWLRSLLNHEPIIRFSPVVIGKHL